MNLLPDLLTDRQFTTLFKEKIIKIKAIRNYNMYLDFKAMPEYVSEWKRYIQLSKIYELNPNGIRNIINDLKRSENKII